MKIAILAPSHKSFISQFLTDLDIDDLPDGYNGAPFIGILIAELLELGHEVIAITTSVSIDNDYTVKEFLSDRFKWIVVPARKHSFRFNAGKLGRIVDLYTLERKLIEESIIKHQPDFIHAHWSYEFAGAAINTKLPCLVTVHDNAFQVLKYFKNSYRLGRLIMSELILRKVRFASTISPYMISYVSSRSSIVNVIPNPVFIRFNTAQIKEIIKKRLITSNAPKLVMIMNGWSVLKNGKVGLQAFDLIKKELPNTTLHLYGYGTEKGGLAYNDCETISTDGVFFHGPVSHNILLNEINDAHVLMHTALEESFGVVLIEAMSQGIPAIGGVKSGAVPWVIDNSELLVDVSKPLAIKKIVVNLLINQDIYQETALKCYYNTINRFSAKTVVREYVCYYNDILKKW